MFKKLDETVLKYEEITAMLSTPEVAFHHLFRS